MQFIDKSSKHYSSRFNAISDRLIGEGTIHYKDVEEEDKTDMKDVLHVEQDGYCAYCMQTLQIGTNDHVIPRSINENEFPGHHRKCKMRQDIVHTRSWKKDLHTSDGVVTSYPHDIAYGNLVLACTCCNSIKDNKKIKPTFFNNPTGVSYDSEGKMNMPADALCKELIAYLNEKDNCKWRRLWYKVKEAGIAEVEVINANSKTARVKILCNAFGVESLNPNLAKIALDAPWKIFISYRWFYTYY